MIEQTYTFMCDGIGCERNEHINVNHLSTGQLVPLPNGWAAVVVDNDSPRQYCRECWAKKTNITKEQLQ